MRKRFSYRFLLIVTAAVLASCGNDNGMPSLAETFSKSDVNPFGTYVAYAQVNELFYQNEIKIKKTALEKYLPLINDTGSLHIHISKSFFLSAADFDAALEFVKKGNSMFISSEYFDSSFLRQFDVEVKNNNFVFDFFNSMQHTAVHLSEPYYPATAFNYYYLPVDNYFNLDEKEGQKILGTNDDGKPDFVVIFYGSGRFYLHCEPRVFSNYFLLQQQNYRYLQQAFAFMPATPEHVVWDDYYNKRNSPPSPGDNGSGFSVLFRYPPMVWAFWLSVFLLLTYILFGGKRRQRIIKQLAGKQNTSVAFTETVSRLYLQKKDNRNMADKMIAYFFEHVRNQYFISTSHADDAFCSMLSRKASVPKEQVESLLSTITALQQQSSVSDEALLQLNNQIENFYKQRT